MTKTMTAAMAKVDAYRDQLNLERIKLVGDCFSCVVYLYESNGRPCAIGYRGRALKPVFNYSYRTVEAREKSVKEWMDRISGSAASRNQAKQEQERVLKVGDVLRASWGYEQTNVDFYKVLRLVGTASVEIVEIGCESIATGNMTSRVIPDVSNVIGEPMVRRAKGNYVRTDSHIHASLLVPTMIMGVPVYPSSYSSSYA